MPENQTITLLPQKAPKFGEKIALIDGQGAYTYQFLWKAATNFAFELLAGRPDLKAARVAILTENIGEYVVAQWGTWLAGGIAVPLCLTHPLAEWAYVIDDAKPELLVVSDSYRQKAAPLQKKTRLGTLSDYAISANQPKSLPTLDHSSGALMVYTSGTTGKPKGAVISHNNLMAQCKSLSEAWHWQSNDMILNVLPLHHVHGIVNALCCALWNGATCYSIPKFESNSVLDLLTQKDFSVFMAVPTIYYKLIGHFEEATSSQQAMWKKALRKLRLMVSGSAALPVATMEKWRAISGHQLLERYGMTETGMILSNPYQGERLPGKVGKPLPGVTVKVCDEEGKRLEGPSQGELWVKGGGVFNGYWGKEAATKAAFKEGWFRTGDQVERDREGNYRMVGRLSVDIIKTGGYKVSALEIEEVIRAHPDISDAAVVGLADEEWGQVVAVAIISQVLEKDFTEKLKAWLRPQLAPYKIPTRWILVEDFPRNAMGKVNKPGLVNWFL